MTINAKRLLKLADYLETVPRKNFNMSSWNEYRPCGFAGCALGWAVHAKLFRGLTEKSLGYEAAEEVFSIDGEESFELFSGIRNIRATPNSISKKMRKFVRANQASAP